MQLKHKFAWLFGLTLGRSARPPPAPARPGPHTPAYACIRSFPRPAAVPVLLAPIQSREPIDFEALIGPDILKPGRYLGNELGIQPRDWSQAWAEAGVRWALTYPEVYEVGASNLGHIILYSILNAVPGQLCDRSYLPAADLSARLRQQGLPLFAVESRRPLPAFDILGFSLSYELGATNILEMLDLAGIPLRAADRGDLPLADPAAPPLILAGGPTATSNPEPFAAFLISSPSAMAKNCCPRLAWWWPKHGPPASAAAICCATWPRCRASTCHTFMGPGRMGSAWCRWSPDCQRAC